MTGSRSSAPNNVCSVADSQPAARTDASLDHDRQDSGEIDDRGAKPHWRSPPHLFARMIRTGWAPSAGLAASQAESARQSRALGGTPIPPSVSRTAQRGLASAPSGHLIPTLAPDCGLHTVAAASRLVAPLRYPVRIALGSVMAASKSVHGSDSHAAGIPAALSASMFRKKTAIWFQLGMLWDASLRSPHPKASFGWASPQRRGAA